MWLKTVFLIISLSAASTLAQSSIRCLYRQATPDYPYTCDLTLVNPDGRDDFNRIEGNHLSNRSDVDVVMVNAFNQNSRIVPSVICRQFPSLKDLYISSSNIETINESAFADCANLVHILLSINRITEVPGNTFRNNGRLEYISLR